jgi:hypothetical protein
MAQKFCDYKKGEVGENNIGAVAKLKGWKVLRAAN